jgi:hypothetical protein
VADNTQPNAEAEVDCREYIGEEKYYEGTEGWSGELVAQLNEVRKTLTAR